MTPHAVFVSMIARLQIQRNYSTHISCKNNSTLTDSLNDKRNWGHLAEKYSQPEDKITVIFSLS